jgi:colicin import membrane protein
MSTASVLSGLRPPRAVPEWRSGLWGSVLAHGGLLAALAIGVAWKPGSPNESRFSAELWASVPQSAASPAAAAATLPPRSEAPSPAAPAPAARPPRAPDIATERARPTEPSRADPQAKARERERSATEARERAAQAAQARTREKAEADAKAALERQREENLRRILGQAGTGGGGTAATEAAPSAGYRGRLIAAIRPNIVFTDAPAGNPAAEVLVRAAPDGTVLSRQIGKSSGNPAWDEAVLRAIDRTQRLPRDADGRVPGSLLIVFRPSDVQ